MKTKTTTTLLSLIFLISLTLFSCKNSSTQNNENEDGTNQETQLQEENNGKDNAENGSISMAEDLSGKVQILTEEQFIQKITSIDDPKGFQYKGKTPAIVDFYADWCRPCVALSPTMEEMAAKYKGKIIIYKVNVDKAKNLATVFNIQSIPTLMFFKLNEQPGQLVGAPRKAELEKTIQNFLK
jgi:thioredoxin